MNRFSRIITQNKSQGASQAMLYALGLTPRDLKKAQIGGGGMKVIHVMFTLTSY